MEIPHMNQTGEIDRWDVLGHYVSGPEEVAVNVAPGEHRFLSVDLCQLPPSLYVRIRVAKDAHLTIYERGEDRNAHYGNITVHLQGAGASVNYQIRARSQADERQEITHDIYHEASHTSSQIRTRAVLKDTSFLSYEDRIHVAKGARQCYGEQHLKALLFSQRAKLHTTPNLEIRNQNVQSKHGVSIKYLDTEWLFYLQSRGLSEERARELVEEGVLAFPEEHTESHV